MKTFVHLINLCSKMYWLEIFLFSFTLFECNIVNINGFDESCEGSSREYPHKRDESRRTPEDNNPEICHPQSDKCDPKCIFYSVDGSCNNLSRSFYGRAKLPFSRMLPANYDDSCTIRKSVTGSTLPMARTIRTTLFKEKVVLSKKLNILFYSFGQFMTHDLTFQTLNPSQVSCCKNNKSEVCLPTIIPDKDEFYSPFEVTCLDVKRSQNTETFGCNEKPCTPINFATSFLDLSILYSSDSKTLDNIRLHKDGLLKTEYHDGSGPFPEIQSGSNCPFGGINPKNNGSCFLIGDLRINQNPEITVMTILFLRMHNYIAISLHNNNPHWDDNTLFNEARRILIAMYQIIIYKEYLPIVTGPKITSIYKLKVAENGYVHGYDSKIDPQVFCEFEAAAGRVSHSMIRGMVEYKNSDGKNIHYALRNKLFNQEFLLQKNIFLNIVESYGIQRCEKQDQYVTEEVTNHIFAKPNQPFGNDLIAIDINRGRDHGLPSYNAVRAACGLHPLKSFSQLKTEIRNSELARKLRLLYKSVDDIDLYVGIILEKPVHDGLLGHTGVCITGKTFHRAKYGDRLYVEFEGAGFTHDQLDSIRKTTFAQILCIANEGQEYVYEKSFLIPSSENQKKRCSELPKINLELWKDKS